MKKYFVFCLCLVLLSVLTVPSFAGAVSHPRLVGTWAGTGSGLSAEMGYYEIPLSLTITEVQGDLFRGTLTVTPPGESIMTIPLAGVVVLPEKELHITLGYTGSEEGPTFTKIQGKLEGRIIQAFWMNIASGDCGTVKLKKSLVTGD